ncbi:hypothetical protein AC578_9808 [Lecanosticta acicola]|uniref:Guanine nucleotide-exchange factor SEC12 n=1 Tax=Lecanosticta acicola TaxID=111012 RepID=A0AAI8Z698_9PEZI|nr:hypothetical protein AC578_9808 [Lecanosticta acicola]
MPVMMKSEVSYAKHTLPYPVFAAEFDPYNRGYLVVAGGGGEGRSGVPNKISVLDVNNRASIEPALEIDLSREEDSVSSIASLATKDGLVTFAGINSSQQEQDAGNNEHLRSFSIRYPPRKKQKMEDASSEEKGEIKSLGRRSLFKTSTAPKKETYQRLLRLSPVQKRDTPGKRIGAVASSLGEENEVIVFNATTALPDAGDIITKATLPPKQEAGDLDIIQTVENEFSVAYCDDHALYEQTIKYDFDKKKAEKRPSNPRRFFHMQDPDSFTDVKGRARFRCLRFLNAENVIALVNRPKKSGAELRVYHLYPTGPGLSMSHKTLPRRITQVAANGLDVCALDADRDGNEQFVVAVAGQDSSIEIFTLDYNSTTATFSSFKAYLTLRDVHPAGITKVTWCSFHSPPRAPNSNDLATTGPNGEPVVPTGPPKHPGPQYIRLASTSFGNTVVVDTFPLSPLEPQKRESRYILSHPGDERIWKWAYIIVISFVVLVTAFLFQSFAQGFGTDVGPFSYLPQNVRDFLDAPVAAAYQRGRDRVTKITSSTPAAATSTSTAGNLRDAVAEHQPTPEDAQATAVVVRDVPEGDGIEVHVHPEKAKYLAKDVHAKHWHELEDHQKAHWKAKLVQAGQWAEDEGESVLKGVLWSTYAGVVGQVGGEIMREL